MPERYELRPPLVRSIRDVVVPTTQRINIRRDYVGLPPLDHVEVFDRVVHFVTESDRAAILWHRVDLANNRDRENALDPNVFRFSTDCMDGRIGRAKKGAIEGIKTEHGQITLYKSDSTGLWIPKDITVQQAMENPEKTPLLFFRIHPSCAAWQLAIDDHSADIWQYITRDQQRHIRKINQTNPELANMIFSELTNRRATDNYDMELNGLERRRRTAITVFYDHRTTGIEFISPLVVFNDQGEVERLPQPEEMKRLATSTFVKELKNIQQREKDPNIPDPGKYKDDYFTVEKFPLFNTELTDLTVAFSNGELQRADGSVWKLPRSFIALRQRLVDSYIRENMSDLPFESQQAAIHKFIHAGLREYLLEGQTHTHNHQEVHGSTSSDGSNVGLYVPWHQTIRFNTPDPETGQRRIITASKVMDGNKIDGERPHVDFIVGRSDLAARTLFSQLVAQPDVKPLISQGKVFPFAGRLSDKGMFEAPIGQTVLLV